MQITEHIGDFIEGNESLIVHGCNAQGVMGSGAAKAVRTQLPFAYHAYRRAYLFDGLHLGKVVWAFNISIGQRSRIVGNAITQEYYGNDGKVYVDYDAVRDVMRAIDHFCVLTQADSSASDYVDIFGVTPINAVGMPMIGSGLAGGRWSKIAEIIEAESVHFKPIVYRLQ